MPANVMNMAYRGATPWHELGSVIPTNATLEEMIVLGGLDYTIETLPIYARIGTEIATPIPLVKTRKVDQISGYQVVWSPERNVTFQIASTRYNPVQPKEVAIFFKEFCDRGELEIETLGVLGNHAINWALAKTTGSFQLTGGDKSECYIMLATSHDGSLRTVAIPTSIRVVCQNTMFMAFSSAKKESTFKMKHSTKFSAAKMDEAKKTVGLALQANEKFAEQAAKLASITVTKEEMDILVYKLTQPEILNKIVEKTSASYAKALANVGILDQIIVNTEARKLVENEMNHNRIGRAVIEAIYNSPGAELPSAKDTLWGAVNGVSYYCDHEAGKDRDSALTSSWFGPRANMKESILELCLQQIN